MPVYRRKWKDKKTGEIRLGHYFFKFDVDGITYKETVKTARTKKQAEEAELRGEPGAVRLDARRFRPNVVVDHDVPFAEDDWRGIRLGGIDFRISKPCDRCVLTTIDPDTRVKGKEPLRTLARHRRRDGKVWFGINLIPDGTGHLRVGDKAEAMLG